MDPGVWEVRCDSCETVVRARNAQAGDADRRKTRKTAQRQRPCGQVSERCRVARRRDILRPVVLDVFLVREAGQEAEGACVVDLEALRHHPDGLADQLTVDVRLPELVDPAGVVESDGGLVGEEVGENIPRSSKAPTLSK